MPSGLVVVFLALAWAQPSQADSEPDHTLPSHGEPIGFWLFNDKYDEPFKDLSGNGHDAKDYDIELRDEFPTTDYKTAHFTPDDECSISIPKNRAFNVKSFTAVIYLKPDQRASENVGPVLLWETTVDMPGTSIWQEMGGIVYARVVDKQGKLINQASTMGMYDGKWARLVVSFNHINGELNIGINNNYISDRPDYSVINAEPLTNTAVNFGQKRFSKTDDRSFLGSMSCAYIFDEYIRPDELEWGKYHEKCFGPPEPAKALAGSCRAVGDPHYNQFDGEVVHHQGTCVYTLARDNCVDGLPAGDPQWEVIVNPSRFGEDREVAWVKSAIVSFPALKTEIELLPSQWKVNLNGKRLPSLPYVVNNRIRVEASNARLYIKTDMGAEILWDGEHMVKVVLDGEYVSKTCGICGVFDADKSNDRIIGPSNLCMKSFKDDPIGVQTSDDEAFVNSWMTKIDGEKSCKDECGKQIPDPQCTEAHEAKAIALCDPLSNDQDVFKPCIEAMKDEGETYYIGTYQNCVFDSCATSNFGKDILCTHAATLADICSNDYDVIVDYRKQIGCPMACPAGSTYSPCASLCEQATCQNPNNPQCSDNELATCEEMCVCDEGYVLSNGKCVKKNECGSIRGRQRHYTGW